MKGIIFVVFNQVVEQTFGLATWDNLLERLKLPSQGVYTAADTYADSELFDLITDLSHLSQMDSPQLVRFFGENLLRYMSKFYPLFFEGHQDAKAFLKTVHDVIHVEVKKLYPDVTLPTFTYEDPSEDSLVMIYHSPRKLCALVEGLLQGTAQYFETTIESTQTQCMHHGDPQCRFELRFRREPERYAQTIRGGMRDAE